jgi:hypothetical protein
VLQPGAEKYYHMMSFLNPTDEVVDTAEPDIDDTILDFGGDDIEWST